MLFSTLHCCLLLPCGAPPAWCGGGQRPGGLRAQRAGAQRASAGTLTSPPPSLVTWNPAAHPVPSRPLIAQWPSWPGGPRGPAALAGKRQTTAATLQSRGAHTGPSSRSSAGPTRSSPQAAAWCLPGPHVPTGQMVRAQRQPETDPPTTLPLSHATLGPGTSVVSRGRVRRPPPPAHAGSAR